MTESQAVGLSPQQKRGIYLTVAGALLFIAVILGMFVHGLNQPQVLSDSELKDKGVYLFDKARAFDAFELVDYNGEPFTPEDLQGKWSLLFFGFTYCPDICPTTMALLNRFYQQQQEGDYAEDLQVVMVSVDPARDTPEKLHEYVRFFNQDFIGVTGEFLQLHQFATQLNIPFKKEPGAGEDYLVEHSGNIAIINPEGHYIGFFRAPHELAKLNAGYESIRASGRFAPGD